MFHFILLAYSLTNVHNVLQGSHGIHDITFIFIVGGMEVCQTVFLGTTILIKGNGSSLDYF